MADGAAPGDAWWMEYYRGGYGDVYEGPLFDRETTVAEVGFLASMFENAAGPILDIGCGFGRHATRLRRKGLDVVGLDRFDGLLRRSPLSGRRAICADMRRLPIADAALAGAYCMFNTFGYFDSAENLAMAAEWSRALKPGALLILQAPNRTGMAKLLRNFPVQQMIAARFQSTEQYEYDAKLQSLRGEGVWQIGDKSHEWHINVRLYTYAEIRRSLERAGLATFAVHAGVDGSDFDARTSTEMVIVARRDG